jgi:hypothetical protein
VLEVRGAELHGRRLKPTDWHVKTAMSPFSTDLGFAWWSLLICYEGLAAFQWPRGRYWRQMLRNGLVAGLAHVPPTVVGNAWPLQQLEKPVPAPCLQLFLKETLEEVEVRGSRFWWSSIRVLERGARTRCFGFVDPKQVQMCAQACEHAFPHIVRRGGWWPAG